MKRFGRSITRASQQGVTLVEIMVAMVVGLILLAGIIQVFISNKQTYRVQEALARIQENGRFAMEFLSRDIRMAGFTGCSQNAPIANVLNDAGVRSLLDLAIPLQGYDNSQPANSFPGAFETNVVSGTDAIALLGADTQTYTVASHNPVSATLATAAPHDIKKNEILVVCDFEQTAIFQMVNTNINNTVAQVVHNTGTGTIGNCVQMLGTPVDCATNTGAAYEFGAGSSVMRLRSNAYYIRNNVAGIPSLYRQRLNDTPASLVLATLTEAEELVEGVENMQIQYGEDTGTDGLPDTYRTANNVANWGNVLSVRISLLLRTLDDNLAPQPQAYTYNGATVTPGDRRLRRVFTNVVSIRNRTQ